MSKAAAAAGAQTATARALPKAQPKSALLLSLVRLRPFARRGEAASAARGRAPRCVQVLSLLLWNGGFPAKSAAPPAPSLASLPSLRLSGSAVTSATASGSTSPSPPPPRLSSPPRPHTHKGSRGGGGGQAAARAATGPAKAGSAREAARWSPPREPPLNWHRRGGQSERGSCHGPRGVRDWKAEPGGRAASSGKGEKGGREAASPEEASPQWLFEAAAGAAC